MEGLAVAKLQRLDFFLERPFHRQAAGDGWDPNYIARDASHARGEPERDN